MESLHQEHKPDKFFESQVNYPCWQDGGLRDTHIGFCNPELSNSSVDHTIYPSFDWQMNWMAGFDQQFYPQSLISPIPITPPFEKPDASNCNISESQSKELSISKRKRRQRSTTNSGTINSNLKKACLSQSKSSSPNTGHFAGKEDIPNDKDVAYLERSRIASNEFRKRKRTQIAQLESEEHTLKEANRRLRSKLNALTSETISLKMQMLRHAGCNCELIQAYINEEAHHFVQSLDLKL